MNINQKRSTHYCLYLIFIENASKYNTPEGLGYPQGEQTLSQAHVPILSNIHVFFLKSKHFVHHMYLKTKE